MKLLVAKVAAAIWVGLRAAAAVSARALAALISWLAKPLGGHPLLTWFLSGATLILWGFEGWAISAFDSTAAASDTIASFWVGFGFWLAGTAIGPIAIRLIDRKVVGSGQQRREWAARTTVLLQMSWLLITMLFWLFLVSRNGIVSNNTVHGILASLALMPSFALSLILKQRGIRDFGFDFDVILLNKTGTLTTGRRKIKFVQLAVGSPLATADEVLALAAGLEPAELDDLAKAIRQRLKRRKLQATPVKDVMGMPGLSMSGRIDGSRVVIGGPDQLVAHNTNIDVGDLVRADAANTQGQTVLYVLIDSVLCGYIGFADELREDVGFFVQLLQYRRKRVVVYSGDAHETTKFFASELGCTEFYGEVLPHEHEALLAKISADGSTILESTDVAATAEQIERAVRDRRFQRAAVLVALVVPGVSLLVGVIRVSAGFTPSIMLPAILASVGLNLALILVEISRRIWHRVPSTILAANPVGVEDDE